MRARRKCTSFPYASQAVHKRFDSAVLPNLRNFTGTDEPAGNSPDEEAKFGACGEYLGGPGGSTERQRNGGGEHTVRIETILQRSQPGTVAAVGIPGLLAIVWR